jgi:F0F1-type ATP synthase membrane subunit b/b'
MEEHVSTSTVVINILIQIGNLVIFFLIFKYFLGDKITETLEERERLIKKLKDAEFEYNAILKQADAKKELILADALQKQKTILLEGELLNKKLTQEIVEDAERKADNIIQNASTETKRIQEELTKNREDAVKTTTKSVVKKLLHEQKDLQDAYLKTLIDDVHTK